MVTKNVKIVQAVGMLVILAGLASFGGGWWVNWNAGNAHNAGLFLMPIGEFVTVAGIATAAIGAGFAWWQST